MSSSAGYPTMFYLDRFPPPPTDGGTESLSADSGWKPKYATDLMSTTHVENFATS